jgi:two-component system chemotaxis sensor kinase CheA
MVDIEFREILDEYFSSARELVENARNLLAEMEKEGGSAPEKVRDLRRALHTLKGNSSMMGFEVVADLSHLMEDLLKGAERGEYAVNERLVAAVLPGLGLISEVAAAGKVPDATPASWAGVIASLKEAERAVRSGPGAAEAEAQAGAQAGARIETDAEVGTAPAQASDPDVLAEASAPARSVDDLRRRYLGGKDKSVRVNQAVLDSLVDLSGELHILLSGLKGELRGLEARPQDDAGSERVDRILSVFRLLEQQVVAARMVPVGTVLSRFRMLVRDLAAAQGKVISFVLEGEATTVDKAVVDELGESLLHLVRNAVDHGIETPAEREAAGKSRAAKLTLAARQASNLIEIAVVDDGRGIDAELVRRKARQKGISVDGLDERAVLGLVFLPEFSTRDEVTLVSGRGVGLDVVKTSLERFGGTVTIQTIPGRGTEFRLAFPLTLALGHCLTVGVGEGTFAIPTGMVAATVRLDACALAEIDEHRVLPWRGHRVPVLEGRRLLQSEGNGPYSSAVVLEGGGRQKALLVDRLGEVQHLVVKPLDDVVGKPFGVSGATLFGDGRIGMILDARELLEARPEQTT